MILAAAADPLHKDRPYAALQTEILAVLEGEPDLIARMATVSAMLAQALPSVSWGGFYLVDPLRREELVVGPYQGELGCLRIGFDRGVCGAAARTGVTQVVEDVHAFPGHIACDTRTNSEIVVPVFDGADKLIAVLDLDSVHYAAFDAEDARALEALVAAVFAD